jgi:hypothetical protein
MQEGIISNQITRNHLGGNQYLVKTDHRSSRPAHYSDSIFDVLNFPPNPTWLNCTCHTNAEQILNDSQAY